LKNRKSDECKIELLLIKILNPLKFDLYPDGMGEEGANRIIFYLYIPFLG